MRTLSDDALDTIIQAYIATAPGGTTMQELSRNAGLPLAHVAAAVERLLGRHVIEPDGLGRWHYQPGEKCRHVRLAYGGAQVWDRDEAAATTDYLWNCVACRTTIVGPTPLGVDCACGERAVEVRDGTPLCPGCAAETREDAGASVSDVFHAGDDGAKDVGPHSESAGNPETYGLSTEAE